MSPHLPRRLIRDIAGEFGLRHSPECRSQNGKGRPYRCLCDFFARVEVCVVEKFRADWSAAKLEGMRAELQRHLNTREALYGELHAVNARLRDLDQKVGDLKVAVAVGEAVLVRRCARCFARITLLHGYEDALRHVEGGIACGECKRPFCDNCYDTGIGDDCGCHDPVPGEQKEPRRRT